MNTQDTQATTPIQKTEYSTPDIIEYGSIETLTQSGGGQPPDATNGSQSF